MSKIFYKYGKPEFTRVNDPRFALKAEIKQVLDLPVNNWMDLAEKHISATILAQKIAAAIAVEKRHPFYKSDYAKGGLLEEGVMYRVGERW